MGHYVYKYVLDGEIIYIGKCDKDLESRLYAHGRPGDNIDSASWRDINRAEIFFVTLANSTMSDVLESALINIYKPKLNKAKMTEWDGFPLPELNWTKYKKQIRQKKKSKELKEKVMDYRDHNAEAVALINKVLHKVVSGECEIVDEEYRINVTDIFTGRISALLDTSILFDCDGYAGHICFFTSFEKNIITGQKYVYLPVNGLPEMISEADEYYRLEKSKVAKPDAMIRSL